MKRLKIFAIIFALILSFTACQDKASAFDEQYDLGIKYLTDGNYEEAIIAFEAAIEIDSKNPNAYIKLADVYIEMGDEEKAREVLDRGLEYNPENKKIQNKFNSIGAETELTETAPAVTTTAGTVINPSVTEAPATEAATTTAPATAPQVTAVISSVETEATAATETELAEDPTLSELKRLSELVRSGQTNNMLRYEEILPFGRTVDSLRSSSVDSIKNLVEQNGYSYDYEVSQHNTDWSDMQISSDYGSQAQLTFYRGNINFIFFYRESVYIRDIAIGDTTEDVLRKLGFSNGAEITECINKLAEPEFDTEEELRAYVDTLITWENCQVYTETGSIGLNCGYKMNPKEGEKFRIANINISIFYWDGNRDTMVSFEFNTDKNDERNFNRLNSYDLDIQ